SITVGTDGLIRVIISEYENDVGLLGPG
ncbi:MAG: hypothetical protein RLY20_2812, partial [Verrucomicrobiota bacterium]